MWKRRGRLALVLVLDSGRVTSPFALDVVVSSDSKWHRIDHGEVEPEFLRRNC